MPLTNYKCGIDVTLSGVENTDYAIEYFYHNLPIFDQKTVWIKSGTLIGMSHNEYNTASIIGRNKTKIGVGIGYTGTWSSGAGTGGGGLIRYAFDKMWASNYWGGGAESNRYPEYSGAFSIGGSFYSGSIPVVGTTGGSTSNSGAGGFYWRGMLDNFGDEWHVLKYADDDSTLGSANDDSWASDGKWFTMVVNPKTPCLTVNTGVSGQFYTTPPYVYLVPKIYQQTTYFQGNCDFTLTDINGNNVFYSINSGGYIDAGSSSVTLTQNNFNNGNNVLEYYYAGNSGYKKWRNIVKNPSFPSSGESHGNLLWGTGLQTIKNRLTKGPYKEQYVRFLNDVSGARNNWDNVGGSGLRLGGRVGVWGAGDSAGNAFLSVLSGYNAKPLNSNKTLATYAKEALIEQAWTTPNLGFELSPMAAVSQATPELNYRGYWDVSLIYGPIIGYDILISGYNSNVHPSGITPVEDYFIRDTIADYVHFAKLWMGKWQSSDGMWGTCRNVGATMAAAAMPTYNTPYYGACGMDGNTTIYPMNPFMVNNYTWKDLFMTRNYTLGSYPNSPYFAYGIEGGNFYLVTNSGDWIDRAAYTSAAQCGHNLGIYRNLMYQYSPDTPNVKLDLFFNKITSGICKAGKDGTPYTQNIYRASALVANDRWIQPAANSQTGMHAAATGNPESAYDQIYDNRFLFSLTWYDYDYFGLSGSLPYEYSMSITKDAITWMMSGNSITGEYANGDIWVLGPVVITGISPQCLTTGIISKPPAAEVTGFRIQNGSMLNPRAGNFSKQGFDDYLWETSGSAYRESLNIALQNGSGISDKNPLVVSSGSIVSSKSWPYLNRPMLLDASVLTIVPSIPVSGQFRPYYCSGENKYWNRWNVTGLNYNILSNLPPLPNSGFITGNEANFKKVWIEIDADTAGRYSHPTNNQPDYGREMAHMVGNAGLALNLRQTNEEKRTLYTRLVQYGLDIYGAALNGANWVGQGGFGMGRKMPLILAGLAFNDTGILYYGNAANKFIFQEDQQTWYVNTGNTGQIPYIADGRLRTSYALQSGEITISTGNPAIISWPSNTLSVGQPIRIITNGSMPVGMTGNIEYLASGFSGNSLGDTFCLYSPTQNSLVKAYSSGSGPFTGVFNMLGFPEWGEKHSYQPQWDGSNWGAFYRNINYQPWLSNSMSMRLISGASGVWNWSPYFDYMDRVMKIADYQEFPQNALDIWRTYRDSGWSNQDTGINPIILNYILTRMGRFPRFGVYHRIN